MDSEYRLGMGQTNQAGSRWVGNLWPLLLVVVVVGLDLVVDADSRSTPEVAAFDEPAHLATGILVVLVLIALAPARPAVAFVLAALVASMAIDLDHLPQYLGWPGLTGGTPRPYTHSLVTPLLLAVVGDRCAKGRFRAGRAWRRARGLRPPASRSGDCERGCTSLAVQRRRRCGFPTGPICWPWS